MKETKQKFTEKLEEKQLAQEINSIEEINNPEPIESFPTTEEIKEVFTGDWDRKFNLPELTKEEPTTAEAVPVIERPKNNVRIMDGNFPF